MSEKGKYVIKKGGCFAGIRGKTCGRQYFKLRLPKENVSTKWETVKKNKEKGFFVSEG